VKTPSEWVASAWYLDHPVHATHSLVEWVLVGLAVCTVAYAFYKAVRHTLYPGETSTDHVKRRILDDEEDPG
jgi:hypothetical protein